jgi:predicted component of type VI protein secretion system
VLPHLCLMKCSLKGSGMVPNLSQQTWDSPGAMTANLSLKFDQNVLQQVALTGGVVTIGRQPDNLLRIDNPIVSGHHATICWENGRYVLEDHESFNGTYLNNRRINKEALKDGDVVLIGKHRVEFHVARSESETKDRSAGWQAQLEKSKPPQLDPTMVLDTAKLKEMMAKMKLDPAYAQRSRIAIVPGPDSVERQHRKIGTITIVAGRTNRRHYVLSSKLSAIGKSTMAGIRLKRWFAPRIAASIHQREDGYFLVAAGKKFKIRINNTEVTNGQQKLKGGDQFEVAGITARFSYEIG